MHGNKSMTSRLPQGWLDILNQVFEIEKKVSNIKEDNSIQRNLNKMKGILEEDFFKNGVTIGLSYHNPLGENYSDTRTDCEATIAGSGVENLVIIEVIKPIIYYAYQENERINKVIVQPAVVIVQSKDL